VLREPSGANVRDDLHTVPAASPPPQWRWCASIDVRTDGVAGCLLRHKSSARVTISIVVHARDACASVQSGSIEIPLRTARDYDVRHTESRK
jgi:hypothetical protein